MASQRQKEISVLASVIIGVPLIRKIVSYSCDGSSQCEAAAGSFAFLCLALIGFALLAAILHQWESDKPLPFWLRPVRPVPMKAPEHRNGGIVFSLVMIVAGLLGAGLMFTWAIGE